MYPLQQPLLSLRHAVLAAPTTPCRHNPNNHSLPSPPAHAGRRPYCSRQQQQGRSIRCSASQSRPSASSLAAAAGEGAAAAAAPSEAPQAAAAALAAATVVVVGIDLGTSNSAVAVVWDGGGVEVVVPGDDGEEEGGGGDDGVMPSVVAYTEDGGVLVGVAALRQAAANPLNTFYSVKRLAGRAYADVEASGAPTRLSYGIAPLAAAATADADADAHASARSNAKGDGTKGDGAEGDGEGDAEGDAGVVLRCPARGGWLAPEEAQAQLLRALTARAERALGLGGGGVASAVITVPARFSESQRASTLRAAEAAGLTHVQLLQEPVAAALAHGDGLSTGHGHAATVLVLDLGGGTADVSLVSADERALECVSTAGDDWLGGDDWDAALAGELLRRLRAAAQGVNAAVVAAAKGGDAAGEEEEGKEEDDAWSEAARQDAGFVQRLRAAAEAAKIALTDCEETTVSLALPPALLPGSSDSNDSRSSSNSNGSVAGSGEAEGSVVEVTISRRDLERCTAPLLARLAALLRRVGERTHLAWAESPEDILRELGAAATPASASAAAAAAAAAANPPAFVDKYAPPPRRVTHCVLVGGASRTPSVRALVGRMTGAPLLSGPDPEHAVALGAATHAGMLQGVVQGFESRDGAYVPLLHGRVSGFCVGGSGGVGSGVGGGSGEVAGAGGWQP